MDLMNLNEHGTKENLQRHEANNLRLSYIIRAIFVLNTMGVTILVGKSEFEKNHCAYDLRIRNYFVFCCYLVYSEKVPTK